jgi:transposase
MGKTTTLEDRMLINELARAGLTDTEIAERVGWSPFTVRKWRRRSNNQGRQGVASVMGRPTIGALNTFPSLIRETLRALRIAHPGWGAKTLRAELETDKRFKKRQLPSRTSIGRFLQEEGLTRSYQRHSKLPQPAKTTAQAPHQEWEMDARGHELVPGVGIITLINLNDRYSRVRLLSYPCWLGAQKVTRHPTTEDYQLVLRLAFTEWGLPDRIGVDHDSVFYDNASKSPFPTRLHLWLLALGISFIFGRVGRATDQGVTERSHQLWAQQVLVGQEFDSWEALYQALGQRREFLNTHLPCASLGEVPPLVAHPEARMPRRLYRPEWEAELLNLSGVYAYLAQGRWFRLVSEVGTVSLGGQVYVLGCTWAKQQVEIMFDSSNQCLVFRSADTQQTKSLPIQGITVQTLMGEMGPLVNLPMFQLSLPFSWDEWRVIRLCGSLGV